MLELFAKYEPIWLFVILFTELCIGLRNWQVLEKEFKYDKEFNEKYIIPKRQFKQKKAAFTLPEEKLTTGEMQ